MPTPLAQALLVLLEPRRRRLAVTLRRMLAATLGTGPVPFNRTLFAAGGDSLHALELAHAIEQRFGVDLPLGVVATQTVLGLAATLAARGVDLARYPESHDTAPAGAGATFAS